VNPQTGLPTTVNGIPPASAQVGFEILIFIGLFVLAYGIATRYTHLSSKMRQIIFSAKQKEGMKNKASTPRSLWKGSISFGLVSIPVRLYNATYDKEFSFNQLCPNGHKIQYKRWCPIDEKEFSYAEIRKGYEITKDKYIIIEKENLDKIKLKTTRTIDVKEFINIDEFDPLFVEKSYYIAPDVKKGTSTTY
jgi:hypothetical protein